VSSNLGKFSLICAVALVGSASLAMAKHHQAAKPDASATSSFAMDQQFGTGPYVPPVQKAQPSGQARPFTWEEKRWFENARGVEAD
jgi:hypothetical protein